MSMSVQGPLSKVEDGTKTGVKRRRMEDGAVTEEIKTGGRLFESVEDTTYEFKGLAKFRVETEGKNSRYFPSTTLSVRGRTKVYVEEAKEVEVNRHAGETLLLSRFVMVCGG